MQEFFGKDLKLEAGVYVVSTPIGNYQDITLRAFNVLKFCDVIFCEDTRVTGKLLKFFKIPKKSCYIYNDHSGAKDRKKVIDFVKEGKIVALVSDAGTPLISDPGYKLIQECYKNNIKVFPIPGASSVVAGLSVSGLPTDKFSFFGFLSSKSEGRKKRLFSLKNREETLVFFESANRLLFFLRDCLEVLGDRRACVARELTKLYEEVKLGKVSELINYYENGIIKGEIVIIIEGYNKKLKKEFDIYSLEKDLKKALKKMSVKDAVELIANENNLNKKEIYRLALKLK